MVFIIVYLDVCVACDDLEAKRLYKFRHGLPIFIPSPTFPSAVDYFNAKTQSDICNMLSDTATSCNSV